MLYQNIIFKEGSFMASKEKKTHDDSAQAEIVRRFKTNPFIFIGTIVILIIVVVAFVLVPAFVPEAGGFSVDLNFGTYNKIPINYVPGNYFAQMRETIARYQQASADANNYVINDYQTWREAFNQTVVHIGILDEMKAAGYEVPPVVVDREVASLPQFQENGRFSRALYQEVSNTDRLALWRQVREGIAENQYRNDITSLRSSSQEAPFIKNMASTVRQFDVVMFPLAGYPDEEIIAFMNANADRFQHTHFSKITFTSNEREAGQVRTSIINGTTTFEDAAKSHSTDGYAERGGDMGVKMVYELSTDIPTENQPALLGLERGAISELVHVGTNWVFFRAEDTLYPADTGDSATIGKVRSYLMSNERGPIEDYFLAQAQVVVDAVNDESPFDEVIIQRGLEKKSFGPLPINYGSVDLFTPLTSFAVPELSEAVTNENFWKTAFIDTAVGTPSKPIVVGNSESANVVILYPVEEKTEDDTIIGYIETAYSGYWLSYTTESNIRLYFLTNKKLDDQFWKTYLQYFMPTS
jgi:hypothetical protein